MNQARNGPALGLVVDVQDQNKMGARTLCNNPDQQRCTVDQVDAHMRPGTAGASNLRHTKGDPTPNQLQTGDKTG